MMYDDYLNGEELTQFHNKVKANLSFELVEIIDNPLFIIQAVTSNIYKIFPLFNCDMITSSNAVDKILDNKCIICENKEETIFNFISNIDVNDLNINYGFVQKFNENILYGVVFDTINNSPIKNVNLTINLIDSNDQLKQNINLTSDNYGGFIATFKEYENTDKIMITASIEDIIKTFEVQA